MTQQNTDKTPITLLPMGRAQWRVWAVSSMEQIIGAGLSTLVGIIIPMIELIHTRQAGLSGLMQGVVGGAGLLGIALGSPIIGKITDRHGYLFWFRICPLLILLGSLAIIFFPSKAVLVAALFIIGFGVGGGYTLDSDYISETMPEKWSLLMVGAAKATCSLGFMGVAALCWWWLEAGLQPENWNLLFIIMAALGLLTFLMRIDWAGSPRWLMDHGRTADAREAAEKLLGPYAEVMASKEEKEEKPAKTVELFKGKNILRVLFSGVTWACEGVGVYGVGVFLPLLIIALGIDRSEAEGLSKVINSVKMTTIINFFIIPGFIMGLLLVRHLNHGVMMTCGFIISAIGMGLLLWAYLAHWPVWISVAAFVMFEMALNAGPHLVTFIIPDQIYPIADRGTGDGIAAMFGKAGAIVGVFLMPMLLEAGGIRLVLIVCISVMVTGAIISGILTPIVLPSHPANRSA